MSEEKLQELAERTLKRVSEELSQEYDTTHEQLIVMFMEGYAEGVQCCLDMLADEEE